MWILLCLDTFYVCYLHTQCNDNSNATYNLIFNTTIWLKYAK